MGNPAEDNSPIPQSSETTDLAKFAGPSGTSLNRVVSAPTHEINQEGTRKNPTEPLKEKPPDGPPGTLRGSMFAVLFVAHPHRSVEAVPSVLDQLRNIATHSWLNLLLVFIPISWAAVSDFPLIFSVACTQADSHSPSYSSGPTFLRTLRY